MNWKRICLTMLCLGACHSPGRTETTVSIYISSHPTAKVKLAAQEIRRYFSLRTGCLANINTWNAKAQLADITFFLFPKTDPLPHLPANVAVPRGKSDVTSESYSLTTIVDGRKTIHLISGTDDTGVLYGAYAFAEQMGVRFYLHGDVVPDARIDPATVCTGNVSGTPLFNVRGIQPFHDFPEGPDWWGEDDYKAVFSQLPKLKMNFFGLHTYPEGPVGPEPTVWIGPKEQVDVNGKVNSAYPARHFTTLNGTWGYARRPTTDYFFRMGDLFDDDAFGTSYMKGTNVWPNGDKEEADLFNTTGKFFGRVFGYARDLGIRTCVGTETPLLIPKKVKEKLEVQHINMDDPATTQRLYEGIFEWVKRNYPIDYYWLWTPEDWTWRQNTPEELNKTRMDLTSVLRAARAVNAPFTIATCGWVLGPANSRAMFDQFLPKDLPMSCINRYVGFEPIEADFAKTKGRPLWAIPWLEDDPALVLPQLWAGRMRRDAADAAAYGCTGLIGIHWRTRILGPNVSALAFAAWEQKWNAALGTSVSYDDAVKRKRVMNLDSPVDDFYRDWAKWNFGGDSADVISRIFAKLDGGPPFVPNTAYLTWLPRPADWMDGPGGIKPDTLFWEQRRTDYRFVDELETLRSTIIGEGNLERFDYWLHAFKYLRAVGRFACSAGEMKRLTEKLEKLPQQERAALWEPCLVLRKRQIAELKEVATWLLATASTTGELGTIANWQQHIRDVSLEKPAQQIKTLMGRPLPEDCWPDGSLLDVQRMIVPTVRTSIRKGEDLRLMALFYGVQPSRVSVTWKKLGASLTETLEFEHGRRGTYSATIPAGRIMEDFEYAIVANANDGKVFRFPATAPAMNQTVVVY